MLSNTALFYDDVIQTGQFPPSIWKLYNIQQLWIIWRWKLLIGFINVLCYRITNPTLANPIDDVQHQTFPKPLLILQSSNTLMKQTSLVRMVTGFPSDSCQARAVVHAGIVN